MHTLTLSANVESGVLMESSPTKVATGEAGVAIPGKRRTRLSSDMICETAPVPLLRTMEKPKT